MGLHPERTACVRGWAKTQTRCATCPPQAQEPCVGAHPEPAACVRGWAQAKTRCASCPPQARGRARLGKGTNRVRELLGAAARLAHRRCARRRRGGVQGFFLLSFAFSCLAFCLSNLFSFVAQAATGIFSLVPSRGFVSGLHVLPPAAFLRTFAPIACFFVLRCSHGFSLSCFLPFPA